MSGLVRTHSNIILVFHKLLFSVKVVGRRKGRDVTVQKKLRFHIPWVVIINRSTYAVKNMG